MVLGWLGLWKKDLNVLTAYGLLLRVIGLHAHGVVLLAANCSADHMLKWVGEVVY